MLGGGRVVWGGEREREGQQCSWMLWREKENYQWRAKFGISGEIKGREREREAMAAESSA